MFIFHYEALALSADFDHYRICPSPWSQFLVFILSLQNRDLKDSHPYYNLPQKGAYLVITYQTTPDGLSIHYESSTFTRSFSSNYQAYYYVIWVSISYSHPYSTEVSLSLGLINGSQNTH